MSEVPKNQGPVSVADLRHRDELARERQASAAVLHELEVHRLELEMQNEELRASELKLANARDRYFDLFDLAPVAYLTLDRAGTILEANFAAAELFKVERSFLIGRKLSRFVAEKDAAEFHLFRESLYGGGTRESRELSCVHPDNQSIPVRMQGVAPTSIDGEQCNAQVAITDLTEIVRAQTNLASQTAELRRTEDRLAHFVRTTNDCVLVLSPAGVIKAVNPATLALLGFGEKQLVGQLITALDHGVEPQIDSTVTSGEITWADVHGKPHTVLLSISPIKEYEGSEITEYLCAGQDITERKAAEERLRASESRLRQMAETIEDGFYMREFPGGELSYASPAYGKIFGLSFVELTAGPTPTLARVHPDDRDNLKAAYASFEKGDPCDEEYRIIRPDGEMRWIRERAFWVEEDGGKVARVVGIAQDITEQRQFEIELRQGQKMEAVGQLASGVAHDFNNILMGIHGCASIGLSKLDDESEVRPFLEAIRKSSESGTAIIKQLLAFSSKRELVIQCYDLNELVLGDETMLARLLGDSVLLKLMTSDAPCPVRMDVGQLEQILMNLAINARDAMPDGGELVIETGLVVGRRANDDFVELRVQDTGLGMSEQVRERIFEPFFTTKGIGEGTGLGLSTVYGIVTEAGGSIRCESELGQGTTFVVRLPRSFEVKPPIRSDASERPATEPGVGTILLVEDEGTVRLATRMYLEGAGYEVIEASNGPDALDLLEQHKGTVTMLLTDVGLPGLGGAALAAKARKANAELPILFMSAHESDWLIAKGRLSEGEQTLQKPFSREELLIKVSDVLADAG